MFWEILKAGCFDFDVQATFKLTKFQSTITFVRFPYGLRPGANSRWASTFVG